MRIVIGGDQFLSSRKFAAAILRRLTARYGPDIVIVLGDNAGRGAPFVARRM